MYAKFAVNNSNNQRIFFVSLYITTIITTMCNAEKRLKLIEEDLNYFRETLKKNNITLKGLLTEHGTEVETILINIEIATDMNQVEADNWKPYPKR